MFKVSTESGDYRVSFQHITMGKYRATLCHVQMPDGGGFMSEARCSKHDNFDRKVGRKLAFARAVSEFERDTRKVFWDEYFKHHKQ